MTDEDNVDAAGEGNDPEAIVREWFRTYSDKEFEAHNALIHPDVVVVYPEMCFIDPHMTAGRDFLLKTLEKDEANFLDLRQTITELWVIDDTVFVQGYFSGSTVGGTIAADATDTDMYLPFLDRIEVEDGMIKLVHCFYDTAQLYQIQLGLEGPTKENPIAPWMLAMAADKS